MSKIKLSGNWGNNKNFYFDENGLAYYSIKNPKTYSDVVKNNVPIVDKINYQSKPIRKHSEKKQRTESRNYSELEFIDIDIDINDNLKKNKFRKK